MTNEDILNLANDAELCQCIWIDDKDDEAVASVIRFAKLVAAAEREACAKVCDDLERAKWESVKLISENGGRLAFAGPMHCAKAIRARGSNEAI